MLPLLYAVAVLGAAFSAGYVLVVQRPKHGSSSTGKVSRDLSRWRQRRLICAMTGIAGRPEPPRIGRRGLGRPRRP
jgi:hypothetical protein